MSDIHELYADIRNLPSGERLRLATLILNGLVEAEPSTTARRYSIDLLEKLPGGRLFKTSAEADEYLREERDSWDH